MKIRKTIKWAVILLLSAAVGGGSYVFWLWNRSDEILRRGVLKKFAEIAPEWDVEFGRARYDWGRTIYLYDFTLKVKGQQTPIATLPEIVLTVDREKLIQSQNVIVHKIVLKRPVLDLVRDARGRWNWQNLPPLPKSDRSCPEWEIAQATIRIRLQHSDGSTSATIKLHNADLHLIPSGKRQFIVEGLTQVNKAGKLAVDGSWDLRAGHWSLDGRMNDVTSSGELLGLAIGTSPQLRLKLARVELAIAAYLTSLEPQRSGTGGGRISLAAATSTAESPAAGPSGSSPAELSSGSVPALGVKATLDVNFRIASVKPKSEPDFKFLIDVRQGQVTNPALPFELHDLKGRVYWDNGQLLVQNMTAKNGVTQLAADGKFVRQGELSPGRIDLSVSNLILDERLRSRLPLSLRKVYDDMQPTGQTDVAGTLIYDGRGTWQPHDFVMTFKNCTGTHVKFPYPVQQISGTLTQRVGSFDAAFKGRVGRRPATMTGWIKSLSATTEAFFDLRIDRLPLDDAFVAACQPPVQRTLKALNLKGEIDARLLLHRPPGAGQPFHIELSSQLSTGTLEYVGFPYRLTDLTGEIRYSSADQTWKFQELNAAHGTAKLTGSGKFARRNGPGLLELQIVTKGARFDRQLQLALTPSLQDVWDETSPRGQLDVVSNLTWIPGQPAEVMLPEVKVTDGRLLLKCFPFPFDDVQATFHYAQNTLHITSFTAKHDQTRLRTKGFVQTAPTGEWRTRLVELYVDDLIPDRLFRGALAKELRSVVEELDPQGPLSISGMLEFRGTSRSNDAVTTAAWDIETIFSGGKLTAGVDLENVHGRVSSRGTWDGRNVNMTGNIDLDSVHVWDYQLTAVQGPFQINGQQLIVGSRENLVPNLRIGPRQPVALQNRVTAKAVGGILTLDAAALLKEEQTYHVYLTASQGRLEQYAQRYLPRTKNLRGVMNGWIDLQGRGSSPDDMTGRGQLQISPAALYELPIIVQIVNVLRPADNAAFRYAFMDFNVADSQFQFNRIDLVGDALSLRGRGTARFDGKLKLDFYSMLPQSRLPIPIVSAILGEATKGWVGVEVGGTVRAPDAKVKPVPQLDDAMKLFLGAFGAGPPGMVPRLAIPPLTPPPRTTPTRPVRPRRRKPPEPAGRRPRLR